MSLDIEQRQREGIVIVDLKGRITMGQESTALRDMVSELITARTPNIVLNLAGVDYIDSTGLGAVVVCSTAVQKADGHLKLLNLNRRNIELLVATKLETLFDVFTDEQDAVNSFFPDREIKKFDILSFVEQMKNEA